MLLPDFLHHAADKVVELWEQINLFAVRDICRRIADAGNHMTSTAEWQIYKMEQSGMARKNIERAMQRILGISAEEVRRIFEEATVLSHENDADLFAEAGADPVPYGTEQAQKTLQVFSEQTNGELQNFTRTTALQSQSIFINACDGAYLATKSGLKSMDEAIRDAIDDAARDGLYVQYPSGHRDTVEVAVRRAVTTGVNRASLQLTIDECERMGTNYVILSSHLGARVSDTNPIANHAGWQGKIYQIHPNRPGFMGALQRFGNILRRRNYPLLKDATGYPDDPLGLGGYNCRHSMYPYIPGVSENHMQQFDEKENREAYENSQRQRAMEREIRKKKRQVEGLKAGAEASSGDQARLLQEMHRKRQEELQKLTDSYRQFCKEKGLNENLERTYIAKGVRSPHAIGSADKMSAKKTYSGSLWPKEGKKIDEQVLADLVEYAKANKVRLIDFPGFDGDPNIIREFIDQLRAVGEQFPAVYDKSGLVKLKLTYNGISEVDNDYAVYLNGTILLNGYALRNKEILQADYNRKVSVLYFTQGSTYRDIVVHEAGHLLTRVTSFKGSEMIIRAFGWQDTDEARKSFYRAVSEYASKNNNELAAECFVKYWNGDRSEFVLNILNQCGILK